MFLSEKKRRDHCVIGGGPVPDGQSGHFRLQLQKVLAEGGLGDKQLLRRPGNSYSYETMEQLQKEYPEDRFFFICGADCLYTIEYWKCADRLFAACTVLAAVRGDADIADMQEKIDALEKKFGAQIRLLPFRRIEIASSEIRERRRKGLSVRYLVPDAVRVYMEEKGLYQDE